MPFERTREDILSEAIHSTEMEGLHVSDFFMEVAPRYTSGEISIQDFRKTLTEHYRSLYPNEN